MLFSQALAQCLRYPTNSTQPKPLNTQSTGPAFTADCVPLSVTWTPASTVVTLCVDERQAVALRRAATIEQAIQSIYLPPRLRTAQQIGHVGMTNLLILCDGELFAMDCRKLPTTKPKSLKILLMTLQCESNVGDIAAFTSDVSGRVAVANRRGEIYVGRAVDTKIILTLRMTVANDVVLIALDRSSVQGTALLCVTYDRAQNSSKVLACRRPRT